MADAVDVKKKLIEMLRSFDTVMVTTHAKDNATMHARPMAIAEIDDAGEVWFVTRRETDKVEEAEADRRAVVTAQAKGEYVSLSGRVDVLVDREKLRALFKDAWKIWLPQGPDDPAAVLWRLRPEIGEYWDNTSTAGIRFLFEAAKALLNGERAKNDAGPEQHAKVPLSSGG